MNRDLGSNFGNADKWKLSVLLGMVMLLILLPPIQKFLQRADNTEVGDKINGILFDGSVSVLLSVLIFILIMRLIVN